MDYLDGTLDLAALQRHGRWRCTASVRQYAKQGQLLQQLARMSVAQRSLAQAAALWLRAHLARLISSL